MPSCTTPPPAPARLAFAPLGATSTPAPAATSSDGFRPVAGGGPPSGAESALVIAYVVMWVLLLGFVWLSFRRQQRLAARITELEHALDRATAGTAASEEART